MLIAALREEIAIPIHLHTHDTAGAAVATVLAAANAGVDAADAAMDSMSGMTSQPSLGAIAASLRGEMRDTGLAAETITAVSHYWEGVRHTYAAFESDMRTGTSDVYVHEMPGGQYTNLRQQARALGLDAAWPAIVETYAAVNRMFGDIVKVTPSSKVVGDMALYMVSQGLSPENVMDPEREIAFPDSVLAFLRGELGQPRGGIPKALQAKALKGEPALTGRPGARLEPRDIDAAHAELAQKLRREVSENQLASYLLYPKVFLDYADHRRRHGDVSLIPTPIFFYGPEPDEEFNLDIGQGKRLIVRYLATSEPDGHGGRTVFFELNGQPRAIAIADARLATEPERRKAREGMAGDIAAPMAGTVVSIAVAPGDEISRGDALVGIEAMKMETTIFAETAGTIGEVAVEPGATVEAKDLLMMIEPAAA